MFLCLFVLFCYFMIVFLELFDHTLYIRKNKKKVSSSLIGNDFCGLFWPEWKGYNRRSKHMYETTS